jgi:hypothetical protein
MRTKKQLHQLITLVVVTSLLLFTIEQVIQTSLRNETEGTIGKVNAIITKKIDPELSIWGASTAYTHFNANRISDSLGITAFNMGIDGTNIDQFNGLLKEHITNSRNSKFIVLALDIHGSLTKRKSLYHIHNWIHHMDNDNINKCFKSIDNKLILKSNYIPFFNLTLYSKHNFRSVIKNINYQEPTYLFPNKGYLSKAPRKTNFSKDKLEMINVSSDTSVYNKIKENCILATQKNIKPIIIITPCYKKGLEHLASANKIITWMKQLENYGVSFYDFSNSNISQDSTLFIDYTHLNNIGAEKLTDKFIQVIKKDFF